MNPLQAIASPHSWQRDLGYGPIDTWHWIGRDELGRELCFHDEGEHSPLVGYRPISAMLDTPQGVYVWFAKDGIPIERRLLIRCSTEEKQWFREWLHSRNLTMGHGRRYSLPW